MGFLSGDLHRVCSCRHVLITAKRPPQHNMLGRPTQQPGTLQPACPGRTSSSPGMLMATQPMEQKVGPCPVGSTQPAASQGAPVVAAEALVVEGGVVAVQHDVGLVSHLRWMKWRTNRRVCEGVGQVRANELKLAGVYRECASCQQQQVQLLCDLSTHPPTTPASRQPCLDNQI